MVGISLCISMALIRSSASPVNIGGQRLPETCIRAGISTNALHVCSIPRFSHEDLRDEGIRNGSAQDPSFNE